MFKVNGAGEADIGLRTNKVPVMHQRTQTRLCLFISENIYLFYVTPMIYIVHY